MQEINKPVLALFDFDGTLTHTDSLFAFIKFSIHWLQILKGTFILSPVLILYKLKLISNGRAKQKVLQHFFSGWDFSRFQQMSEAFALQKIPGMLRRDAFEKLNWHIKNNHRVIVITASCENWIKPWTDEIGLELIATQLEVVNKKITGKFRTPNCHGAEKVNRIKAYLDINQFYLYGYGDSKGDKYFLNICNEKYYKKFTT